MCGCVGLCLVFVLSYEMNMKTEPKEEREKKQGRGVQGSCFVVCILLGKYPENVCSIFLLSTYLLPAISVVVDLFLAWGVQVWGVFHRLMSI